MQQNEQMQSSECMQFAECADTPFHTLSPSMPTTPSPTPMLSREPTYFVPFWNKSLDRAVDILNNGTHHNSCEQRTVAWLVWLMVVVAAMMSGWY